MEVHRKMAKHFNVKVNNKQVKILNYKRDRYYDVNTHEEVNTIEIITKIPNDVLDQRDVEIDIEGEATIIATWSMHFFRPGLHRYKYIISE